MAAPSFGRAQSRTPDGQASTRWMREIACAARVPRGTASIPLSDGAQSGIPLRPRVSQKEPHIQSAAPKGQQQGALTIVWNFPTAVCRGIPLIEDRCCRKRVFQLFSPLWMSLEACDRFKFRVRHLGLKHFETAAHVVEAPHGKNRHNYSHGAREKCLSNLRRESGQGPRTPSGKTSQDAIYGAKKADKRCGRRNGGECIKPALQESSESFTAALEGPLGECNRFSVGKV